MSEAPASVAKLIIKLPVTWNNSVPSASVVIRWYSLFTGNVTCTVVAPHCESNGVGVVSVQSSPRPAAVPAGRCPECPEHNHPQKD